MSNLFPCFTYFTLLLLSEKRLVRKITFPAPSPRKSHIVFPFCSDRTDVESTHSSNLSGFPEKNHQNHPQSIPPDALYATSEKMVNKNNSYISANDALFNDSKVCNEVVAVTTKSTTTALRQSSPSESFV